MSHTRTEEKTFEAHREGRNITAIVDQAVVQVAQDANAAGFQHQVLSTFRVIVVHDGVEFRADASAVYAKIVPTIGHRGPARAAAPQEAEPEAPPIDELSEVN